jgi:hypothetical protein
MHLIARLIVWYLTYSAILLTLAGAAALAIWFWLGLAEFARRARQGR